MAEVLASLKKIGGNGEQYTETVLWTNPDASSNFTGQNVTLSDSISNYKYIKFTWKTTTTDTSSSSAYVLSSDLASMTNSNGSRFLSLSSLWTNVYSRNITYNSATSVSIATSTRQGASGNNNGVNIPLEILGINELAHGKKYITNFVAIYSGSGTSSTTTIASKGYITDSASDGDTISAGATEYFTEQNASGTSGYIKVYAAKDLDAIVIEGYATATYKNRHFSQGDLIGTINRNVSNTLWIGVYE